MRRGILLAGMAWFCLMMPALNVVASEPDPVAVERGRQALLGKAFSPPAWMKPAYDNAWRQWEGGLKEKPANYTQAVMERYGLHPAPYPNNGYPMGLRETHFLLQTAVTNDCLVCHGGAIMGKSYVGLGNTSLEIQALFEELNAADGRPKKTPFTFGNVRGTNEAGSMAVYLLAYRDPDLNIRMPPIDLGLRENLCEDVPAWWLLKKKKTMYHTGGSDARSVRSIMQFMMHPLNPAEAITRAEADFKDIQAYMLGLEAPKYPFPIDAGLARKGEKLFRNSCSTCHGTYGPEATYPNKIVPLEKIGTDRTRFDGISPEFGRYYNKSWFAKEKSGWLADEYKAHSTKGYQAPPLDGIWATAPYLHNGALPTVYQVLNSKARPAIFTRSYGTGERDYDSVKLGWKVQVLDRGPDPALPAIERRKVYDTTQPGRGNGGHTFGDDLSDEERWAIIEYLKTI